MARHLGQKVGSERFPDIVTLRLGFENTPIKIKNVVKLVLCEIEKKLGNSEVPERDSLSIEHFYPKAAREEWRRMVGGEEKIRQMEDTYVETFGNLTLLEPGLNSKAGNKSFNDKLMIYEDESSLRLNSYFSNCEKWDIDEIKKRARRLCEIFVEIDIFKDIKSELRPTRKSITLNSEGEWNNLKPRFVAFPNGGDKRVLSAIDIVEAIIEYLRDNHYKELEIALRRSFDFIDFGEVEKKDGLAILPFGNGSTFVCNAKGESLRTAAKKLVEACDLEPSEFEIITI